MAVRGDETAQDLPERSGGAVKAAAGREVGLAGELEQEDAPRLIVSLRLDLPRSAVYQSAVVTADTQLVLRACLIRAGP
jgi:hypothetical protein